MLSGITLAVIALVTAPPAPAEVLAVGQPFPRLADFVLEGEAPDTTGSAVLIVDFWASWCAPCRAAFPVLDEIQAEFKARGVRIVGVSVDQNREAMERFLKRTPVSFAVARDAEMKLVRAVDVPTMPTTFVIDRQGVVRFVHDGFRGEETAAKLREEISMLLKETTP